jgi:hypothetical protein
MLDGVNDTTAMNVFRPNPCMAGSKCSRCTLNIKTHGTLVYSGAYNQPCQFNIDPNKSLGNDPAPFRCSSTEYQPDNIGSSIWISNFSQLLWEEIDSGNPLSCSEVSKFLSENKDVENNFIPCSLFQKQQDSEEIKQCIIRNKEDLDNFINNFGLPELTPESKLRKFRIAELKQRLLDVPDNAIVDEKLGTMLVNTGTYMFVRQRIETNALDNYVKKSLKNNIRIFLRDVTTGNFDKMIEIYIAYVTIDVLESQLDEYTGRVMGIRWDDVKCFYDLVSFQFGRGDNIGIDFLERKYHWFRYSCYDVPWTFLLTQAAVDYFAIRTGMEATLAGEIRHRLADDSEKESE